jgi:hypothetical protein
MILSPCARLHYFSIVPQTLSEGLNVKCFQFPLFLLLSGLLFIGLPNSSDARDRGSKKSGRFAKEVDRAADDFGRIDRDGDGKLSSAEWRRRGNFKILDGDADGFLSLGEIRGLYRGHDDKSYDWPPAGMTEAPVEMDPSAAADRVPRDDLGRETRCAIGRSRRCDMEPAKAHGLIETGLGPRFPEKAVCPGIDDIYAMDYGFKRSREAYHGGIDMPARWGTPIVAAAAGTVVGKFQGENSARGIEIVLRHSAQDTGLPLWVYTSYAHLDATPKQVIGQRVRLGEILGPTGNSGVSGRTRRQSSYRRPAIHFAAFYAASPEYGENRDVIIPLGGHWMDPIALYCGQLPVDSAAMKALPEADKTVAIPVLFEDGEPFSAGAKMVWPYRCKRS